MTVRSFLGPVLLLALSLRADPPPTQPIFDGRTLGGWQGNSETWRVEDGALTGEIRAGETLAQNEFIYWNGELHDFVLELEFRISGDPSANSGIQFRSQRRPDGHAAGYQADLDDGATWLGRIYDEHGRALLVERGTRVAIAPGGGRWVDEFAPAASFKSLYRREAWNTYRITAKASHVEIWINGVLVSALDDHQAGEAEFSGLLALQLHSGRGPAKVQFRNLRIAHLGRTALPPPPAPEAADHRPVISISPTDASGQPLNFGFETGKLDGWTVEGDAWSAQPVRYYEPDTPRRKGEAPTDPVGNFWIGPAKRPGPHGTGRLISPTFEVTHRWASYLVGGGSDINRTRIEVVDASTQTILHSASGRGSDALRREVIDFGRSVGRRVFIRLVDQATEGLYGHIDFDDFVFHDRQPDFTVNPDGFRQHESAVLWHLQPNPAAPTAIPNVDAQKVVRDMKVMNGFQAELIAAEPDIHQPIAFAIDERGRLWVAEAYSYPTKQPAGQGKDRILIFEDADGDGSFETRKVFIEGLNLVSGLEVGFGGVWIGAAPELLFIPDRDRDDRPDAAPQVLLDGWGYQDTHETLNSFTWGVDGWLYGVQGVFTTSAIGKPGTPDNERLRLRAGVWRYHPLRHEFEIFASGGSNQWGLDFNEAGHLFMTHCRSFYGGGGTTHVIRNGHYWNQANSDYAPFVSNRGPDFAPALKNYLPSSARYDSGEGGAGKPGTTAVYGGHSHVGTMIYLGDNWPDIYRDHLFTLNLHGHQMNQQHNVRQGSGYETFHAGFDLLFASDRTFMGVDLQYGPDGAVYLIDWCDHQHCHSPRDDIWERTNGRLYRMAWRETWKPTKVNLYEKTDLELAALHTHKNEWFVRTSRRLLQERSAARPLDAAALAELRRIAAESSEVSQILRVLFTLHVVDALDAAQLATLLQHPSDLVRSWGVTFATERRSAPALPVASLVVLASDDPSPTVRLAIASALPALAAADRWEIAAALARHAEDIDDRFLPRMIWFGIAPLMAADPGRGLEMAASTPLPSLADSIRWFAAQSPVAREQLVAQLVAASPDVAARAVRLMAFALESESSLPMPPLWPELSQRFLSQPETSPERAAALQLAALFGDEAVLARTRATLDNTRAPLAERENALALLKRARDPAAVPVYIRMLEEKAFRSAVIPLLAGVDNPQVASGLLRHFESLNDADRAAALATLTSHPRLGLALLEAVSAGTFDRKHLTALHVRQLRSLRNKSVDTLLDRLWGRVAESPAEIKAEMNRYRKSFAGAPRWAYNPRLGQETFQQLCATCHKFEGQGGNLGPDLTGSWRNGVDYFIENIVDPNAVVGTDFQLNVITKNDGSVVSGMVERESETALVVRTATETVNVPKSELKHREVLEQSLMPVGLLQTLSEKQVVELLMFLTERP